MYGMCLDTEPQQGMTYPYKYSLSKIEFHCSKVVSVVKEVLEVLDPGHIPAAMYALCVSCHFLNTFFIKLTTYRLAWVILPATADFVYRRYGQRSAQDSADDAGCLERLVQVVAARSQGAKSVYALLQDIRVMVDVISARESSSSMSEHNAKQRQESANSRSEDATGSEIDALRQAMQLLDLDLAYGRL
jgi:hypothetical protein